LASHCEIGAATARNASHFASAAPPQAGPLFTWTLIGTVAGGMILVILADCYGRVAERYWELFIYRTVMLNRALV
jgi:hypothetical protein